jgi:hypothetical protein
LVGVITNGTAVLGLGAIGPLAAKPVMEGKAVLFKKFAGIDVFDIEVEQRDPQKLVELIAASSPPSGPSISRTSRRRNASRGARIAPAHEYSGVPRRPAWHGHHRRCRLPQWAAGRGQGHRRSKWW